MIAEYAPGGTTPINSYVYGPSGLIKRISGSTSTYCYQDASGSTSQLADNTGALLEWCRYDLQGAPIFYDSTSQLLTASTAGNRFLFTGQQWYSNVGVYDLRNRFYSPDTGRFLQADPIGFKGDATNLYRYCGNNPIMRSDPAGETYWVEPTGQLSFKLHIPVYYTVQTGRPMETAKFVAATKAFDDGVKYGGTGKFGSLNVETVVDRRSGIASLFGQANHVEVRPGKGPGGCGWESSIFHLYENGGKAGKKEWTPGEGAAHELLLHGTIYDHKTGDLYNQKTMTPEKGFENSLRGGQPGVKMLRPDEMKAIIEAKVGRINSGAAYGTGNMASMSIQEYNWTIAGGRGPAGHTPTNAAEATNYASPTAMIGQVFMTDFAFGSWDPDSPYPAGPVGSAMYGNHSW